MTSDAQILASHTAQGEVADPRRWLTLVILLLAAFMNLLDVSIVNIAIPSIQRDLHASYADVQWALAGYTLAYALVLITGGRLGERSAHAAESARPELEADEARAPATGGAVNV
jgi:MFS family permease